ncbi:MAG: hypothetical protein HC807_08205 [Gammaproteobacteria bacterium]|nr:hypothetical protein [Gammaproteobacteria bacterium]
MIRSWLRLPFNLRSASSAIVDKRAVEGERLQKALSAAGLASRRQVEEWIRAGRITVNGDAALLGQRVGPRDVIRVDGRTLRLQRRPSLDAIDTLFLCHRSPGDELREGLIPADFRPAGGRTLRCDQPDAGEREPVTTTSRYGTKSRPPSASV